MKSHLKYGVPTIALLAAFSLAQAQERQGAERGGTAQPMQSEHGGGGMKNEGTSQRQGGMEKGYTAEKGAPARTEKGTAQNRTAQEERGKAQTGYKEERAERGDMREENRTGTEAKGHRTAKNAPSEQQKEQSQKREGARKEQGTVTRQRESQAGTVGRSETLGREGERAGGRINVNATQKSEIRDVIHHESGLRVYHRREVHFAVRVGERLPDTIMFYNAPPRLVELVPDFRRYKIIVLDDEILVIDPETREIVDVIPV